MDVGSIASAISSLKSAIDLVKSFYGLHSESEISTATGKLNQALLETQNLVFAAYATQATLINRVRELESEITRMKDWNTEKQRYKLAAPFPGCMVYAVQKSMCNGEPAHYLCATCYNKGEASILQCREGGRTKEGNQHSSFFCHVCKSAAVTQWMNVIAPKYHEELTQPLP